MSKDNVRQRSRLAVYMIFKNEKGEILLIRRHNTGWRDGEYTLPAGHIDPGETALGAAIHESMEEVRLNIREEDLKLLHIVQYQATDDSSENYINFYFECKRYEGIAKIGEPNKADDLIWMSLDKISEIKIIDTVHDALKSIDSGKNISFSGF